MAVSTITGLLPTLYNALDVVSREMVGFIPAVAKDSKDERAALNQQILVPVTTAQPMYDVTPGVIPADDGDQTINSIAMYITKSKRVPIRWNGEQQKGLTNAGTFDTILGQQFQQAFRTLVNAIEVDCFTAAYQGASRAYGTPGTTPFGVAGDLSDSAQLRKILDDNGAPQSDMHLVLGSAAVANLRGKQTILLKANEAGTDQFRRTGALTEIPLDGFMLHNSNAVQAVTKGAGTGYVTSGATAIGVNSIALVTGSGTVLAGDVVSFAGDPNKYVVTSGVSGPGTITIGGPGVLTAIASGTALTINNSYTPNVGFVKSAIQLITRAPAMPLDENGRPADLAEDMVMVTDPVSGITFEVVLYPGYRSMKFEVCAAWGVTTIANRHVCLLTG